MPNDLAVPSMPLPRISVTLLRAVLAIVALAGAQSQAPGANSAEMNTTEARSIYEEACAVCHGDDGSGAMPGIPDLTEPGGHLSKSDEDLVKSIVSGIDRPGMATPMPPSGLNEGTARAVLNYLRAAAKKGN